MPIDKCPAHEGLTSDVKAIENAAKMFGDWQIRDDYRQDMTEELIGEIRKEMAEIKTILQEILLKQKDYATWSAHDSLKDCITREFIDVRKEIEMKNDATRKYVVGMMTLGIAGASIIVQLITRLF